jgi:DNA invertase Pin-like site-specific DNA recombinase
MPTLIGLSYGRVSTDAQYLNQDGTRKDDSSPEAQRARCLKHLTVLENKKSKKCKIIEHISDEGFSGKNVNRPGYQKMWDLVSSSSINFIIAPELSRLNRSVVDFLEFISHCESHEVEVHVIGLDLDTSSPMGRVIVIVLMALAQFEREMTGLRVKENALARLLGDGKINGSAEILGLDKDPDRKGHFGRNEDELKVVEKLLKLFLKFSSKKKLLGAAQDMGLKGKKGKELTRHILDTVLRNVRWRYRGLWYVNLENQHVDPELLPEPERFLEVELPHGSLIDIKLLDAVEEKLADTHKKNKQSGSDNFIYLLSHVLYYEDGTKFSGQAGKGRAYRYYFNKENNIRIRHDEIDKIVVKDIRQYFLDQKQFSVMVENAVKLRQAELPKIDQHIRNLTKQLERLEQASLDLRGPYRRHTLHFIPETWFTLFPSQRDL